MPTGTPKKPTAVQVAKFGHSTATIREALKKKGWEISDLNLALGKDRGNALPYHWVNGKGCPSPRYAALVAKALNVDIADLAPRDVREVSLVKPKVDVVRVTAPPPGQRAPGDVLTFSVDREGNARIKLDAVLPVEQAAPLFRMLLDAGIVMGRAE